MMSSTERTRSISGSGPGIVGGSSGAMCEQLGTSSASSASDLMLHQPHGHGLLQHDYVIGNMNLFQNFASGVGEQPPQHSSVSGNSSSSAMNISHISSSAESSASSSAPTAHRTAGAAGLSITHNVGGVSQSYRDVDMCRVGVVAGLNWVTNRVTNATLVIAIQGHI